MKRTLAVFYNNFRLVFLLHRRNNVIDDWGRSAAVGLNKMVIRLLAKLNSQHGISRSRTKAFVLYVDL